MEWQNVGYEEDNDNIHSWKVIKNNGRSQIKLTSRWRLSVPCPASRSSFCLLEWGEKRLCLNGVKALRWHLVFCHQTGLFKSEHPFLDKPMVKTTHAVTSAQQLDLVQDYIVATCCKGAKKMWHIALGRKFGLWVWISVIFRGVPKKNGTSPIDLCHAVAILSQEI